MRNRTFTDNLNKQDTLYKTNNQPVLNDAQRNDAKLVKKLPRNFPFGKFGEGLVLRYLQKTEGT